MTKLYVRIDGSNHYTQLDEVGAQSLADEQRRPVFVTEARPAPWVIVKERRIEPTPVPDPGIAEAERKAKLTEYLAKEYPPEFEPVQADRTGQDRYEAVQQVLVELGLRL